MLTSAGCKAGLAATEVALAPHSWYCSAKGTSVLITNMRGWEKIQRWVTRIFRGVERLPHQEQPQRPGLSSRGEDVRKDGCAGGPPSGMGRWVANDS